MRYAIYFTPPKESPLTRLAASWLGRDPFSGETIAPPATATLDAAGIAFHSAAARRYGFHATLKAPFHLAASRTEASLVEALSSFAAAARPFVIPRLAIGQIDGFFALVPAEPVAALDTLAGDVVRAFDDFRSPLTESEIERRNPDALSAEEFHNLHRWGYPYVFGAFRFHMTLTGRVAGDEAVRVKAALDEVFGDALARPIPVGGIALFVEPEARAPFTVHSYAGFAPRRERKSA